MVKGWTLSCQDQEQDRHVCSHPFSQHCTEVLAREINQEKEIHHIQIRTEEAPESLFSSGNTILHVTNPKTPLSSKLSELINEFSKVTRLTYKSQFCFSKPAMNNQK